MPGFEIQTPRLRLAPFAQSDRRELLAIFRDAAVRRYLLDDAIVEEEWVRREIEQSTARFASGSAGLWRMQRIGEETLIGFVGFRDFFEPPELQLLYGLLPAHWGQGLATEAARGVVHLVFERLGFPEIRAATDTPNRRSAEVLRRLGMEHVESTADGVAGTEFYLLDRSRWADEPSSNSA